MMELLDLRVFEIMDYSEGATVEGNTELTRQVVDTYYETMPEAIGFVNGYAPAFTFTCRGKRPLISYDYYLSPTKTEEEAVADLHELAAINARRPYFLLMHVREYSNVKRVKSILDKLGPDFELVPLVVGSDTSLEDIETIADAIRSVRDPATLVVASSDFTHYGERFRYAPFSEDVEENIMLVDFGAIEEIRGLDYAGLLEYCSDTGATICGKLPIAVAKQRGLKGIFKLLTYLSGL